MAASIIFQRRLRASCVKELFFPRKGGWASEVTQRICCELARRMTRRTAFAPGILLWVEPVHGQYQFTNTFFGLIKLTLSLLRLTSYYSVGVRFGVRSRP
jgi:hypothetical protein